MELKWTQDEDSNQIDGGYMVQNLAKLVGVISKPKLDFEKHPMPWGGLEHALQGAMWDATLAYPIEPQTEAALGGFEMQREEALNIIK